DRRERQLDSVARRRVASATYAFARVASDSTTVAMSGSSQSAIPIASPQCHRSACRTVTSERRRVHVIPPRLSLPGFLSGAQDLSEGARHSRSIEPEPQALQRPGGVRCVLYA